MGKGKVTFMTFAREYSGLKLSLSLLRTEN
jgi:hypothetical protein